MDEYMSYVVLATGRPVLLVLIQAGSYCIAATPPLFFRSSLYLLIVHLGNRLHLSQALPV